MVYGASRAGSQGQPPKSQSRSPPRAFLRERTVRMRRGPRHSATGDPTRPVRAARGGRFEPANHLGAIGCLYLKRDGDVTDDARDAESVAGEGDVFFAVRALPRDDVDNPRRMETSFGHLLPDPNADPASRLSGDPKVEVNSTWRTATRRASRAAGSCARPPPAC
jgi:hypothetical protein